VNGQAAKRHLMCKDNSFHNDLVFLDHVQSLSMSEFIVRTHIVPCVYFGFNGRKPDIVSH
ncbi:hypothetical protein ACJMK2_033125, partial [Sinanodonta woodiana]